MDKELVHQELGAGFALEVELVDGKLQIVIEHKETGVKNMTVVPPKPLLQAIKKAIPGSWDDMLIDAGAAAAGIES